MVLILNTTLCYSSDIGVCYWNRLQKQANKIYSGIDTSITVNLSTDQNDVTVKIPIFSKADRVKKIEAKRKYLEDGAKKIAVVENGQNKLDILKKQAKIVQAIMIDEGIAGINEYYDILQKIVDCDTDIQQAIRELSAMLN